jgi:putative peptidoglycan lipid II flippase
VSGATLPVARIIGGFALGLIGFSTYLFVLRAFYALQDTRTPVIWAVVAVAINVPLMAWLVGPMGIDGLALAMSLTAIIEVLGLVWALRSRLEGLDLEDVGSSLARSAIAGGAAALLMFGALRSVELWLPGVLTDPVGRLLSLIVLSGIGLAAFILVAAGLRSGELGELRRVLGGRFGASNGASNGAEQ